jgi:hypothetical protein
MIRGWSVLAALALLCLWLAWGFVTDALLFDPYGESTETLSEKAGETAAPVEIVSAWGPEIVEKNLFDPRRGYTPPAPPAGAAKPPVAPAEPSSARLRPNLVLSGIILDRNGEYIALIAKDKAPALRLRVGDWYEGTEVASIRERDVTLRWQGQDFKLMLRTIQNTRGIR